MDIRYCTAQPDVGQFKALYDTTGWGDAARPTAYYEAALAGSWAQCTAYAGERMLGFGRVISDGALHAFITEMIIAPDQQGRGIGRGLLARLVACCHAAGITDIQLFCAEGKEAFYRKGGFEPRLPSRPGMQYVGAVAPAGA